MSMAPFAYVEIRMSCDCSRLFTPRRYSEAHKLQRSATLVASTYGRIQKLLIKRVTVDWVRAGVMRRPKIMVTYA